MLETKLIRRPQVEELTGLKRSQIYANVKKGLMPAPVKIGAKAVAWRENEILSWINSRPKVEAGGIKDSQTSKEAA